MKASKQAINMICFFHLKLSCNSVSLVTRAPTDARWYQMVLRISWQWLLKWCYWTNPSLLFHSCFCLWHKRWGLRGCKGNPKRLICRIFEQNPKKLGTDFDLANNINVLHFFVIERMKKIVFHRKHDIGNIWILKLFLMTLCFSLLLNNSYRKFLRRKSSAWNFSGKKSFAPLKKCMLLHQRCSNRVPRVTCGPQGPRVAGEATFIGKKT